MRIEFPDGVKTEELQSKYTLEDLRVATNQQLDIIRDLIKDLPDAYITFEPDDPDADDYAAATEEEATLAWNLAHVILHAVGSSEEGASRGSTMARGVEVNWRSRYEPDWKTFLTVEQVLQRVEESRRMRLAFLDTWPDQPHLEIQYGTEEWFLEVHGVVNAIGMTIYALKHEYGHLAQMEAIIRQAKKALG